ncbi:MAG: sigma-54 dependent transcriptional regulator [Sedimentisphaerales bacterium]
MTEPQIHNRLNVPDAGVLLVSRSPELTRLVLETLARKAILGMVTGAPGEATDFLDKNDYRLVLIDIASEGGAGPDCRKTSRKNGDEAPPSREAAFELLGKIRTSRPEMPVVMVETQAGRATTESVATAVKAIQAGCCDFIACPAGRKTLEKIIDTYVPNQREHCVASAGGADGCVWKIVGKSPALTQTVNLAGRVAPTSASVLVTGESGVGKELISYIVHYNSRRADGPFVKVNCAALSETLFESELFGHEKGAFTGAYTQRKGRFEAAHGGTLLLDEISETPLRFQAKLLRVLEGQDFQRVGSNDNINVDVRIISTTNKDLSQEAAQGRFRQDLFYRLSAIRLQVPALRQRMEDLPDLVWHFVKLYAGQTRRCISRLDPAMMEIFSKYHWPGNIRQLRNVVLTSLVMGVGETLSLADVSWLFDELQPIPEIRGQRTEDPSLLRFAEAGRGQKTEDRPDISHQSSVIRHPSSDSLAGVSLAQIERRHILDTLKQTNGNQTRAAKVLGISDRTLREKIRRFRQEGCLQPV